MFKISREHSLNETEVGMKEQQFISIYKNLY